MENHSSKAGLFRRIFSWRTLRWLLIAAAALVTLLIAFVTEENWRARHDWEKYKATQEAKGERFDMDSFIPKMPPLDQNFAMTPFLAPLQNFQMINGEVHWNDSNGLARMKSVNVQGTNDSQSDIPLLGDWRHGVFCDLAEWQYFYWHNTNFPSNPKPQSPAHDILLALQKFDPIFSELRTNSERPYAVMAFYYDPDLGNTMRFSECRQLVVLVSLRAKAELGAGQSAEALKDIKVCLRLSQLLQHEPLLISQLVRFAMIELSIQPIWEGLARHSWTDAQLEDLQKALAAIQSLDDYDFTMRGERAFGNQQLEQYRAGNFGAYAKQIGVQMGPLGKFTSKAFLFRNQLALNRMADGFVLPAVDSEQHRVFPERCSTNALANVIPKPGLYNVLALMSGRALAKAAQRFAHTQNSIDLATVATALERYHLAHGAYPETLDTLAPQFIEKVPNDVIGGQPLKYHRSKDDQFILYSIGWDQTDDGGKVATKPKDTTDPEKEKGDWVWQYPAK